MLTTRLLSIGASIVILVLLGWGIHHDGYKSGHQAALDEGKVLVAVADKKTDLAEAKARGLSAQIEADHQAALKALEDARAATPTRTVRLCNNSPNRSSVPSVSDSTTGTHETTDEGLPDTPGPDIGAGLYALADEADTNSANCQSLVDWVNKQAQNGQPSTELSR
jgi:hypothetical protein